MPELAERAVDIALRDGRTLRLRSMRGEDEPAIRAPLERLDEDDRARRCSENAARADAQAAGYGAWHAQVEEPPASSAEGIDTGCAAAVVSRALGRAVDARARVRTPAPKLPEPALRPA